MNYDNEIKVSVVVAVYNSEGYLRECMDSILAQTLSDIEVICVNDGSTDSSLSILNEYAALDGRVKVFTKENEGLGGASARNLGISKASGKYLSILDSDDIFEPDMLEKAYHRAEETNADVVVFGGYEFDEKSRTDRRVDSILKSSIIPVKDVFSYKDCADSIFQLTQGMAWNKLYRRSFIQNTGILFHSIKYTDDAFFTFSHMVRAEKIAIVDERLIHYRVNSGRNQTGGISNYPDSSYIPYLELKDAMVEWGIYDEVKRSFINCATTFIRYCYDMIDRYDAFLYLHDKLRGEVFDALGISDCELEDYDDPRTYMWVRQVSDNTAGELLFKAARAYGSADSTTGILRFSFPYDRIPRNSRVALIGERLLGRNYYAQVVLSGYCDICVWVGKENPQRLSYIHDMDALMGTDYDYYLIAYSESVKIAESMDYLKSIGIREEKIVLGEGKR